MPKLTKRYVEAIQPDSDKTLKFWDSELKGFGVIVLPSGRRTYCVEYRNADKVKKRLKIGIHGPLATEEARNLALIQLGKVAHGQDIATQIKQVRNTPTMNELAQDYVERHGQKKRLSSLKGDQRLLKNVILPAFGTQRVALITRRDLEELHMGLSKEPYKANRTMALLSKMFSLAVSWEWRQDNPVKGIQKYQEEKRDRWLNEEELQRLWNVLDQHPRSLSANIFKFYS
jgi:hypothetical protein